MQPSEENPRLRLAVFGGSSGAGRELVAQALALGYAVKALVRTPAKLALAHDRLTVVAGDVLDAGCVEQVVQGTDAVLSTLGPSNNRPTFTISRGMQNILPAMQKHQVRRLIVSAGAGIRDAQDRPKLLDRVIGLALRLLANNVRLDMERTVELVRASDREWTIVRVPRLVDGPRQKTLQVGYVGEIGQQVTRADLAAFMLQQVTDTRYLYRAPAISNELRI